MARSYSDPSYGSKKSLKFQRVSMGTRAADTKELLAGVLTVMTPSLITDWSIVCDATGNGGTSTWVLKKGTLALGTLSFVTNPTAGTVVTGITSVANSTCAVGDLLFLYTSLSTAAPQPFITPIVEYKETFDTSDS